MYSDRPKLKIPFLAIDIVIELVSITLLILMWTHLIIEYNSLPETIASHFNAKGEPDDYSKKNVSLALTIISNNNVHRATNFKSLSAFT